MPILNELIVSIVGGVATAAILAIFTSAGRRGGNARADDTVTARRTRSIFGDLVRIVIAATGGFAIAVVGGRMAIEAGVLPRGLPTRLGLLVVATALIWLFLVSLRRR